MVRAFNPYPGAFTNLADKPLKIWQAREADLDSIHGKPGEIIAAASDSITVACGHGALRIEILQPAGGKKLTVAQFMAGHTLTAGDRFVHAGGHI